MSYDHKSIDAKWQKRWEDAGIFHAKNGDKREKYYVLVEFPYPSGAGLHVGHPRSYTALDVVARKKRMDGKNVLFPMGWDAFGLPAENYALKTGIHPSVITKQNIDTFRRQLQSIGFSFDWSREIDTTDPKYYKWTQWQFLQFFKAGLAYKAKTEINWCPKDKIGLANEEVVQGCCERCGTPVEKREKEQWMLAITKYADRLIDDLKDVDYLPKIKKQQEDWIGRSEGAEIMFPLSFPEKHKYVILHGFQSNPNESLYVWLKQELERFGHQVVVPELPNTDKPSEQEQVEAALAATDYDENTIVCGFSLGSVVAMKVVERLKKPIKGLILAGGFADPNFKDKKRIFADRFDWQFDGEMIRKNTRFIIQLQDTEDYAVSNEQAEKLSKILGVEPQRVTSSRPHFCGDTEPIVLKTLLPQITVFTTRPDTIFGATYLVLAPEHPWVTLAIDDKHDVLENKSEVAAYVQSVKSKTEIDRTNDDKEKTGVELKGVKAMNPATGEEIPLWISDYVLGHYGTGAIMAVPEHDDRDRAFAEKFDLPIVDAPLVSFEEALQKTGGQKKTTYKLRDWVFSRQRYWGEPIPLVQCEKDGWVAVPDAELPVLLPEVEKYQPTDNGESPLAVIDSFINTACPTCGGPAKRETDTMPNWAGSSWYFLRYTDPDNDKEFASKKALKYWMPVDLYNGGMEHTTLHLLYSRFWNKFLFDQGLVPTSEPYVRRHSHGLIMAEDGTKMSKSKGNVVNPDDIVQEHGADTLRMYELFMGPFEEPVPWSTNGVIGVRRFLDKVVRLAEKIGTAESNEITRSLHKTIKKVTDDIENFRFNTAIAAMMAFVNEAQEKGMDKEDFGLFLRMLVPFAPHVANELFEKIGGKGFVEEQEWPKADAALLVEENMNIAVQVNGKTRATISVPSDLDETAVVEAAKADENVKKFLTGEIKKTVVVKGRIVNFVV